MGGGAAGSDDLPHPSRGGPAYPLCPQCGRLAVLPREVGESGDGRFARDGENGREGTLYVRRLCPVLVGQRGVDEVYG